MNYHLSNLSRPYRKPLHDFYRHLSVCVSWGLVLSWRNQDSMITYFELWQYERLESFNWTYSNWDPYPPRVCDPTQEFVCGATCWSCPSATVCLLIFRERLHCSSHSGPAWRCLHICRQWNHAWCLWKKDIWALLLGDIMKHLRFYVLQCLNLLSWDPV